MRRAAATVAPLLAAAALCALAEEARTTRDRIYTSEQAERGKLAYQRACASCHALDYYKGVTMKPWEGGTLSDLYDTLSKLMPPTNPGSLKRAEYLDILAYILSINGMPSGASELPEKPEALKSIQWRNKP